MKVPVAEHFVSLQGEGVYAGTPSMFVRLSGCNLRCVWCDTPHTSWRPEPASWVDIIDIADEAKRSAAHVVITGGEPMVHAPALAALCALLQSYGKVVTVETNGTIFQEDVHPNLWSVSPKLGNSTPSKDKHPNEHRLHTAALKLDARFATCRQQVQFKFVAATEGDFAEAMDFCRAHEIRWDSVMVMPEGRTNMEVVERARRLAPLCVKNGVRLCMREQILLWGNTRNT